MKTLPFFFLVTFTCLTYLTHATPHAGESTSFQSAIDNLAQQFRTLNQKTPERPDTQKISGMHKLIDHYQQTKLRINLASNQNQQASPEEKKAFNALEKQIWTSPNIYNMLHSIPPNLLSTHDKRTFNLAMRFFNRHEFQPVGSKVTFFDLNATSLPILQYPDPELHKVAADVTQFDDHLQQLIDQMFETMYNANGIGLAGTQVGKHQRIVVMDISPGQTQPLVFINPIITITDNTQLAFPQGCLSVKDTFDVVKRPRQVRIEALDRFGKRFTLEDSGLIAVCIQHELDHLNGKLFIQHLSEEKQNKIAERLNPNYSQNSQSPNS